MSEESPVTHQPSMLTEPDEQEMSVIDVAIVLAEHKKVVFGLPLAAAILAAGVSFLLPNIYTATAKILPPQQGQSVAAAMLAQQFGALMGTMGSQLGIRSPNDMYIGMLKSRTVADSMIARFELQKLYDRNTMFDTRKKLWDNTTFSTGKDGIITIEFEDKDPQRAAAVANGYVEELYKLTTTLAISEASQRRLFFENQLRQTRDQLSEAEIDLRRAIDTKGLAGIDVQSRAILEPSAQLRAQIALREVQLSAIRIFATDQHPDLERLRHEIASMKRELGKLEGGDGKADVATTSTAGFENLRRFRDVKFLERLTELLTQQFEAAKIDEAKDMSIIQVLDKATEPDKKTKPRRGLIVVIATFLGGIAAIGWVFVSEMLRKVRSDAHQSERFRRLIELLR